MLAGQWSWVIYHTSWWTIPLVISVDGPLLVPLKVVTGA
jgi:hypothetical protein